MPEPERLADRVGQFRTVYRIPKRCPTCGLTWEGNSWTPPAAASDALPRIALCDICIAREEALIVATARRSLISEPPITELSPPREPGE